MYMIHSGIRGATSVGNGGGYLTIPENEGETRGAFREQ